MERLTDTAGLRDPMLRTYNRPAGDFSGDLLCATRGPRDILYLLLADATGHGLPAALSAMPLPQVFYGMAAKGFSLASMAEELNRKLKRLMPADRFVAATLAAIDVAGGTVEIWTAETPTPCSSASGATSYSVGAHATLPWASCPTACFPARHRPVGSMHPVTC